MPLTRRQRKRMNSNAYFDGRRAFIVLDRIDKHLVGNTEAECECKLTASISCTSGWNGGNQSPDIVGLFAKFNEQFFCGSLHGVEVRWTSQMAMWAGVCDYDESQNYCSITLSAPLLKLRPHNDVVNTLLHEMIHAFLYISGDYRYDDDHGPKFHSHMNRINKAAGTNITVYHSFYEEMVHYNYQWWRCDGPCQNQAPLFGVVKRPVNWMPELSKQWWLIHKMCCGGTFTKIREPVGHTREYAKYEEGIASGVSSTSTDFSSGPTTTPMFGIEKTIDLVNLRSIGMTGFSTPIAIRNMKKYGGLPVFSNELVQKMINSIGFSSEQTKVPEYNSLSIDLVKVFENGRSGTHRGRDTPHQVCSCEVCHQRT